MQAQKIQLQPIVYDLGCWPLVNDTLMYPNCPDSNNNKARITIKSNDINCLSWSITNGFSDVFSKTQLEFIPIQSVNRKFSKDTTFASPQSAFDFWKNNWKKYVIKDRWPTSYWGEDSNGKWGRMPLTEEKRQLMLDYEPYDENPKEPDLADLLTKFFASLINGK